MENPICNTVFDSRDLIEYRDHLADVLVEEWNNYKNFEKLIETATSIEDVDLEDEGFYEAYNEEISHYNEIVAFCAELASYAVDFQYGETIIHSDHFVDYCQQLCEDCGYLSRDFPTWIEIDWNATSENMATDYTIISYGNEDYYIR